MRGGEKDTVTDQERSGDREAEKETEERQERGGKEEIKVEREMERERACDRAFVPVFRDLFMR